MHEEVVAFLGCLTNLYSETEAIFFEFKNSEKYSDIELTEIGILLNQWADMNGITLIIPVCSSCEGTPNPVFSIKDTLSQEGRFSELYRKFPCVLRSHNPTHSVAAYGKYAEEICAGHRSAYGRDSRWGEICFGINSPWDWMTKHAVIWAVFDGGLDNSPLLQFINVLSAEERNQYLKTPFFPEFSMGKLQDSLSEHHILTSVPLGYVAELSSVLQHCYKLFATGLIDMNVSATTQQWISDTDDIAEHGYLQAAKGKTDITPPLTVRRWEGKTFCEVAERLFARCLALRKNDETIVLVNLELLGISDLIVNAIRERVHIASGIDPHSIMIAVTHAHSTPDTFGAGFEDESYIASLISAVSEMILKALEHFCDVRLGWQIEKVQGIAQSRRILLKNGTVYTTRYGVPSTWRVNPSLIEKNGNHDNDLTVIRVESLNGDLFGAVSCFACHPTVAIASRNIGGDFFGESMRAIERIYVANDAVMLCFNGAAGDVDPTCAIPIWGPRDDQNARNVGRMFAADVLRVLERVALKDKVDLENMNRTVTLPLRASWLKMLRDSQSDFTAELAEDHKLSAVFADNLEKETLQTDIQLLRINGLNWFAFSGEMFSDSSIALKQMFSRLPITVCELANGNIGYVPTPLAFDQGGYEVNGVWGKLERNAEEKIFALAAEMLSTAARKE